MGQLSAKTCVPCTIGAAPLAQEQRESLLAEIDPQWRVVDGHHLERAFAFDDFRGPLAFTVRVGELAEEQGHHPDIYLSWGRVVVTIWTHKIDGLTESDFVLAAKIDEVPR